MSHYEINVSRHGKHVFATHPRSLRDQSQTLALLKQFRLIMPISEGWCHDVKQILESGTRMNEHFDRLIAYELTIPGQPK